MRILLCTMICLSVTALGCGGDSDPGPPPGAPEDVEDVKIELGDPDGSSDDGGGFDASNLEEFVPPSGDEEKKGDEPKDKGGATPTGGEDEKLSDLKTAELIDRLADDRRWDEVSDELLARGEPVVDGLVGALQHENSRVRAGAVFVLGRFGQEATGALPALEEVAQQGSDEILRDAALYAIDAVHGR